MQVRTLYTGIPRNASKRVSKQVNRWGRALSEVFEESRAFNLSGKIMSFFRFRSGHWAFHGIERTSRGRPFLCGVCLCRNNRRL